MLTRLLLSESGPWRSARLVTIAAPPLVLFALLGYPA